MNKCLLNFEYTMMMIINDRNQETCKFLNEQVMNIIYYTNHYHY